MTLPNAWARHHNQGTSGTSSLPKINKQAPIYYASPTDVFPGTSGRTTALAKGGLTPTDKVAQPLVCSLSFATPLTVPAGNFVSLLSQSAKTLSKRKRDGPTITNPYTKKTRPETTQNFHSGGTKNDSPSNVEDDNEIDYVPITNQAINSNMEGKDIWEEDGIAAMHCKVFYLKVFPPVNPH
jgi:hypothetical protein